MVRVGRLDVSALNNAFVAITVILGLTIILIPLRLRALDRQDLILAETTELQFSKQQSAFDRIRVIQVEMKRLAQVNNWVQIEQQLGPSPTDIINEALDIKFGSHVL